MEKRRILDKILERTLRSSRLILQKNFTVQIHSCCFSHDGSMILSSSADKTLKLWKASDYSLLATLTGHSDSVCFFD